MVHRYLPTPMMRDLLVFFVFCFLFCCLCGLSASTWKGINDGAVVGGIKEG